MLRTFARWYAMRKYLYREEFEAAVAEINASAARYRATETRAAIARTRKEADDIDANIKEWTRSWKKGFGNARMATRPISRS
jgi:hypothetical protein